MGVSVSRKMSGKTLLFAIVFLFVAWVPCFEATLHWNPASFWDMRNPRQWDRDSGPLQQVEVEEPVVQALSQDLGEDSDEQAQLFNNKPIKVSPIGMFSYLLRMAEASRRKRCRSGQLC